VGEGLLFLFKLWGCRLFHKCQLLKLSNFQVWMDLYTLEVPGSGGKTCSKIFEEAACDPSASPSCAACMGGPRDTYGRLNEPQVNLHFLQIKLTLHKILLKMKILICSKNSWISWKHHVNKIIIVQSQI